MYLIANSMHCGGGLATTHGWLLHMTSDVNMKEVLVYPIETRGELSYLAPLGSENFSAPYFKQCFFRGGDYPPDSQTPRLPVLRQK